MMNRTPIQCNKKTGYCSWTIDGKKFDNKWRCPPLYELTRTEIMTIIKKRRDELFKQGEYTSACMFDGLAGKIAMEAQKKHSRRGEHEP